MRIYLFIDMSIVCMLFMLCGFAAGKECTNTPPQLNSHTFRHELLSSKNETWKQEMFSHYHLTPTDDSAWSSLLPRKMLKEEVDELSWAMMYKKIKNPDEFKASGEYLKEVSLHNVRLDSNSIHGQAQQTNLEYLLLLDVDNLLWSFRKTAGLPTKGEAYGGWESPDVELRGHFVGHYLSASAQMWASTHNDTLKKKISSLVAGLAACQEKIGSGYLSAFPSEEFDRFEAIKPVWAPYYTIHKILAGLLDQYTLADDSQALKMVIWMVEYFYNRVENVILKYSIARHYYSLNEETGGMNDVLYRLFRITANPKHLILAHLFDKPCFLGLLAVQADDISGFHANTHIPIVIGSQMRYEITGEPLYKEISRFFMEIVNSSHSYATGGTSSFEFWKDPKRIASTLNTESEESCTTYNMLKVSRNLFRWTKEVAYADYYEQALTNGVLSIQRGTDPGVMIYMLPLGRGTSKAVSYHGWGTQFNSFWCCYGTGIESFSKLGDSIYFEEEGKVPSLYIVQYISSYLKWESGEIEVDQRVDPVSSSDPFLRVTLQFSSKGNTPLSTLNLRVPSWTQLGRAKAALNGQSLASPAPGSFLSVSSKWSSDDKLTIELPISLRTEPIKDDRAEYATIQAILFGPYLLAAHSSGDWDLKTGPSNTLSESITPIPPSYNTFLSSFSQTLGNKTYALTNSGQSITMQKIPESSTDDSRQATFRLILTDQSHKPSSSFENPIGQKVSLEPFDFPGKVIVQKGMDEILQVVDADSAGPTSVFHLIEGLDGDKDTISFESESKKGCYIYSGVDYEEGVEMKLTCNLDEDSLKKGSSFIMREGLSQYHPISFVVKGVKRNFILAPLLSFRDETYTVYFNITG